MPTENWPNFAAAETAQLLKDHPDPELAALYARAYAAYPDWLDYLRGSPLPIAEATLMVCERMPELASAIFVAGYVGALVDGEGSQG